EPTSCRNPDEYDGQEEKRERARGDRQRDERREPSTPLLLQRPQCEQGERRAEREGERSRENGRRPEDREAARRPAHGGTPFLPDHNGEGKRCQSDGCERERLDPDHGREWVIQQ